jgi:hypothetical protein
MYLNAGERRLVEPPEVVLHLPLPQQLPPPRRHLTAGRRRSLGAARREEERRRHRQQHGQPPAGGRARRSHGQARTERAHARTVELARALLWPTKQRAELEDTHGVEEEMEMAHLKILPLGVVLASAAVPSTRWLFLSPPTRCVRRMEVDGETGMASRV